MTLLLLACHTPDPVGKAPTEATTGESTVANAGPTAPLLHIEPVAPFGGDTLTVVVDRPAADLDGDALAETRTWSASIPHPPSPIPDPRSPIPDPRSPILTRPRSRRLRRSIVSCMVNHLE